MIRKILRSFLLSGALAWQLPLHAETWVKSMGAWAPIHVDIDSGAPHPESPDWRTALIAEPVSPEQRILIQVAFLCEERSFSLSYQWVQVRQGGAWKTVGAPGRDFNWVRMNAGTPAAIQLAYQVACSRGMGSG